MSAKLRKIAKELHDIDARLLDIIRLNSNDILFGNDIRDMQMHLDDALFRVEKKIKKK